jgi:chromosome segregation ATPase
MKLNSGSSGLGRWIAAGALLGLAGVNGFLFWRVNALEGQMAKIESASQSEIAALREASSETARAMRRGFDELGAQLSATSQSASAAAQRAASAAQKHADKLARELSERQRNEAEQLAATIGEVRSAAERSAARMTGIESSVDTVRTEVSATKTALDQTLADLKSVRGDLGVQSGLIATNSKELAALRELGERNYFEFNVSKKMANTKVGGIVMTVKKVDTKRNKYNLEIVADDKRVEKKDKTINEPVQFYAMGSRTPYEIVVNEVRKDAVIGYLATPKVIQSRR